MDWLRELHWGVFWWGSGMVALLAGGALYSAWWGKRNVKAIRAQKPVDVSDVAEGYRLAWGRTWGPELRSPLTGRPCVWWKAEVWKSVRENLPGLKGGGPDATRWVWRQVASEESDRPLLFGDGKAVAAVWTWGATVIPSGWSDWRGQSLPPEEHDPELRQGGVPGQGIRHDVQGTFGPRFRYVEQIIAPDAPIFVLGDVTRVDPALYAPDDGAESEQESGEEDVGEEEGWRPEPNPLGLRPTPDAVIAADMTQARWVFGAAKGQPFLVSTEHPGKVSAEQKLGAMGGLIMGGMFSALAIFLLWARFGG